MPHGGAGICRRRNRQTDGPRRFRRDGGLPQGAFLRPRDAGREDGPALPQPQEGVVLSRESRSSEKFMHGIKVLMAKNYIDNLSEEARKGMTEKAEQGIWPTKPPLGSRNTP